MNTIEKLEQILRQNFKVDYLEFIDESFKHTGHSEAKKSGGGHFELIIVSDDFTGKSLVERHRMVNQALKSEFKTAIHALSIKALTPEEFK